MWGPSIVPGRRLARLLLTLPGTRSAFFEPSLAGRTLEVEPDLEALARNGVALPELQLTVEAATTGLVAGTSDAGSAPAGAGGALARAIDATVSGGAARVAGAGRRRRGRITD